MPQSCLLALALCCLACTAAAVGIRLQPDGRYTDVLVSISEDIDENWELVEKIKSSFSAASRQLEVAASHAGQSVAFGDVHILVPASWNRSRSDAAATWETQDRSSFRVGQTGQSQPPDTVQPGGCGRPGLFVTLHREHLLSTEAELLGKQLVHEFARLRWGVFREFNSAEGPHGYLRSGRIEPVACARAIKGRFAHKDTGLPCRVDRQTLELEPDCRFVPNDQQTAKASLMYATYLPSVDRFCNESDDENVDHDAEAPTPHNRQCNGLSVSGVMRQHPDFRGIVNATEVQTQVNFKVVRPRGARKVVIVMDVSLSMRGLRLAKLKIAGRSLVLKQLENGVFCSLVAFNSKARELTKLQQLNSRAIRRKYWATIRRLRIRFGTAIGMALLKGMEVLGADTSNSGRNLNKNDTGYIVLLSDGKENRGKVRLPAATRQAARTSIVVDTIALGNRADKGLAELSRITGGKSYFSRVRNGAIDLLEALADLIRDRVSVRDKPIDIFSSPVTAGFSQSLEIDQSVTSDASVVLSSLNQTDISRSELQLTSPSGAIYDRRNGSFYEKDEVNGIISINIPGQIEAGRWQVTDVGASSRSRRSATPVSSTLTLVVSSKPSDDTPLILDGSVSDERVRLTADTRIAVFASLQRGAQLLMDANISAVVESDGGEEASFLLLDNGAGADAQAGDGVYSGMVPTTVQTVQEYNVRLVSSQPVARVSTAGKFEILSVDQDSLRRAPPSTVEDLRAAIDLQADRVTLSWTGVGDRRMEGTPAHYILLLCPSSLLLNSNSTSTNCSSQQLPTPPAAAGERMSQILSSEQLGSPSATVFLGVSAVSNSSGIQAEASNPVSVQFALPDNIDEIDSLTTDSSESSTDGSTRSSTDISTPSSTDISTPSSTDGSTRSSTDSGTEAGGLSAVAIVFIVLGCVLAVGAMVAAGVFCWWRRGRMIV